MTSSHFIIGWAVYLAGATGCLLALMLITGRLPVRFKRALRFTTAALLYTPWWLSPGSNLLSPALFTMAYDGLTDGIEGMARTGLITVIAAGSAALIAIILPVKKSKAGKEKEENTPATAGHRKKPKRQEPIC
ncbi:hypothetical protein [Endozoicomonas numazuensis]|uniref:Uncharacterized protein n=1 Tax=Endozoicomonas numazuensis TaxID=1137799 RepID=A0A081NH06_9GAMM|nr:hypothetical protein [Endozoicomonas numazuensis]KEQ17729.1 hypothetical protein GZ78_08580 [Endozoicomonas numazuensis]